MSPITRVTLRVNENQDAAVRLYRRFQFLVLARDTPGEQTENLAATLVMERSLNG